MEYIKDIWHAVILDDKIVSAHKELNDAEYESGRQLHNGRTKVERVQVQITRIKT